jgi:hypothetical protein
MGTEILSPGVKRGRGVTLTTHPHLVPRSWSTFDPRKRHRTFSSKLCVQTGSGGPPSLLYSGYRGPFPGGKAWPGRDADHSPPSTAEVVIDVRSSAEAKDFSSNLCPDRLWGPPSLLYNGYRGPFPGGKARQGRDADHSPPSSAEVVIDVRSSAET